MSAVLQGVSGFRPMAEEDLTQVLAIEAAAYEFPWTRGIFIDCLRMAYSCWVYEQDYCIAAYGIASVAAGESHILNLCVAPENRRSGLGRYVLNHLISIALRHNAEIVLLEVRPSNQAAIALYDSEGFAEVGLRSNYYPAKKDREDALIFARALP